MRLIDADKLQEEHIKDYGKRLLLIDVAPTVEVTDYDTGYQDGVEDGLDEIRPKGYWIGQNKDCRGYCDSFKCSECGALIYPNCVQIECDYPSCPFCLADMRGDEYV